MKTYIKLFIVIIICVTMAFAYPSLSEGKYYNALINTIIFTSPIAVCLLISTKTFIIPFVMCLLGFIFHIASICLLLKSGGSSIFVFGFPIIWLVLTIATLVVSYVISDETVYG